VHDIVRVLLDIVHDVCEGFLDFVRGASDGFLGFVVGLFGFFEGFFGCFVGCLRRGLAALGCVDEDGCGSVASLLGCLTGLVIGLLGFLHYSSRGVVIFQLGVVIGLLGLLAGCVVDLFCVLDSVISCVQNRTRACSTAS